MYKILLVSHGKIAKGFYDTLPMLLGTQDNFEYVCFEEGMNVKQFEDNLNEKIQNKWSKEEVLVLADMLGGTPSRIVAQVLQKHERPSEIICGLNLSLIIDSYMQQNESIEKVADSILESGKPSFMHTKLKELNEEDE